MKLPSPQTLLARPLARWVVALVAIAVLSAVVRRAGAQAVLALLARTAGSLPWVALFEVGTLVGSTLALRALYGGRRSGMGAGTWLRSAMLGYAVGMVAPLGRASAEAARAVLLARHAGGPRAAVAAVQMQGIALLANALLCGVTAVATAALLGANRLTLLMAANMGLALVVGIGVLWARRARPGRLLGKVAARGKSFGGAFDACPGASASAQVQAFLWESAGRSMQVAQLTVVLVAVLGKARWLHTLAVLGTQQLGQTVGDALPAQLGAPEASLSLAAHALALTPAAAAAVPLLVHAAQLGLAGLCALALLVGPWPKSRSASELSTTLEAS